MAQFINLFTWGYRCLAVQAPSIEKTTYSPPPFHLQLSFFVENFLTMFILVYFWASCCVLLIYLFFLWPASQSSLFQLIQQVWSKVLLVTLLLLFLSIFLLCCIFPLFTQTWVTLSIPTKKICYILNYRLNYKKSTLTIFNISTHKHELSLHLFVPVFISPKSYSFHKMHCWFYICAFYL